MSFYTTLIKALMSERVFALCQIFGVDNVGLLTGDVLINADATIICCIVEMLANISLREAGGADVDLVSMDEVHCYAEPDCDWT